jgi:polyhydroxyalkanoate synthase
MELTSPSIPPIELTGPSHRAADIVALRAVHVEVPGAADRLLHGIMAEATQGLSPTSLTLAYLDWAMHLAQSPGKWQQLAEKAWKKDLRWLSYATRTAFGMPAEPCIQPLPQDRRFRSPEWQRWPYNLMQQAFLLNQQWWHNATTGVDGVTHHHEQVVSFVARQLLDMMSPVNFIATNPEVIGAAVRERGANFVRGAINFNEDLQRTTRGEPTEPTEQFRPGIDVAATPGKVVYRNRLIELIQYSPTTASVHAEPMLIVPAWIMKYYILDLSPHNSLVKYLVDHGHTVFMISWHNPTEADRDLGMEDYLHEGVFAALDTVHALVPERKINAVGYCLGGTLLSIAAAALDCGAEDNLLNSMSLLAAQADFSEAGELMLFIDESQIAWLEDLMWQQGFLDNRQMAGAFKLLRSNDLVWSLAVNEYLLGRRAPLTDLMAWNADATRMPYRMHSEYLRRLFLNNDLSEGRYRVEGRPVALTDIHMPMFGVATMSDHVSPWRSVHKIHLIASSEVSFVLTNGGHNAGIISEPGHRGRYYYFGMRHKGDCYTDPDRWVENADECDGSWWPEWTDWLERVARGPQEPARQVGASFGPAPGRYVLER